MSAHQSDHFDICRRILIDTGAPSMPEYIANLQATLDAEKASITVVVCTHAHPDHVGGMRDVLDKIVKRPLKMHKYEGENRPNGAVRAARIGAATERRSTGGHRRDAHAGSHSPPLIILCNFSVLHTPGHTADHIALYLYKERALFSGDCVLADRSGTLIGNLADYVHSLHRLRRQRAHIIYPGHGPVINDPEATLNAYAANRLRRDAQIVAFLAANADSTIAHIVQDVYPVGRPPPYDNSTTESPAGE